MTPASTRRATPPANSPPKGPLNRCNNTKGARRAGALGAGGLGVGGLGVGEILHGHTHPPIVGGTRNRIGEHRVRGVESSER